MSVVNVLRNESREILEYVRDEKRFPLNRYVQFCRVDGLDETKRRQYPFSVSYKTIEAKSIAKMIASQATTNRTTRIMNMLQKQEAWGEHTGDWLGSWNESILMGFNAIQKATNGMVRIQDVSLIVSQRLSDKGIEENNYGVKVIVEDSPLVISLRRENEKYKKDQRVYAKNDTTAIMVSRVGGMEGKTLDPATVKVLYYGDPIEVCEEDESHWHIAEQFDEVINYKTGFLITNC